MNIDIPTQFNSPPDLDAGLSRDLSRLGNAVEQIFRDPTTQKIPSVSTIKGNATLALDTVTRLLPPLSGTVLLLLPAAAKSDENHEATLIVTATSGATIAVMPPRGTTLNGAALATFTAAPGMHRYIFSGGNWYSLESSTSGGSTTMITYSSPATITMPLASKTTGQGERSDAIDNSTNRYDDALVSLTVKPGTISAGAYIQVMAYSSVDGTNYETAGSTAGAYNTLTGGEKILGYMIPAASTTAFTGVFAVAQAFGGVLPPRWGIIASQVNCGTLSATESDHVKSYVGITRA